MIVSFADRATEEVYHGESTKRSRKKLPSGLHSLAVRKLDMLTVAKVLDDLRSPPGNHLETLEGSLKGYHSVRINDQWRILFCWTDIGPKEVEIIDYH